MDSHFGQKLRFIFMMTRQDFRDDKSRFFLWTVEIFMIAGRDYIINGWDFYYGRSRFSNLQVEISSFCSCCYSRKWGRGVRPRSHNFVFVLIQRIRRQGESKIPLNNLSGRKLLLNLLRVVISYWVESYLESCWTSTMELFCENSQWP